MTSARPTLLGGQTGEGGVTDLDSDEVFQLLTNRRRRDTIRALAGEDEDDGGTDLGTLADEVAAAETGAPIDEVSSDERQRVYISLYQSHLPALDDADVVRYDEETSRVEPGPNLDPLVAYLDPEAQSGDSSSWLGYHLLAGCVGLAFWTVHFLNVLRISPLLLHTGSILSSLTVALGHLRSRAQELLTPSSSG
ncbi:DUF7344 domain-containing protein [Haloarchaeobius amylolyticus]|uniref:DUF7344 domain-containing protein n=1 Tax=Haloarchaeobius amylolyticus TaxID=1198296 RepID=UPI00226F8966|nr:hypothetical protein [Haloarchaeobius amylolyticus]